MFRSRPRFTAVIAAAGLLLTACGASAGTDTAGTATPPAGDEPSASTPAAGAQPEPDAAQSDDGSIPQAVPAVDEPAAGDPAADQPDGEPATDAPATPPADAPQGTDAPPPAAEIGGRAFASALAASSDAATNPLPDLIVDDVRRGAEVNLRNVFPADRPVLIWMWAPH